MPFPAALVSIRLFVRLLLGVLLLSVGVSKLAHPRQFQWGIENYHIVPPLLEKKLALTALLSFGIPPSLTSLMHATATVLKTYAC